MTNQSLFRAMVAPIAVLAMTFSSLSAFAKGGSDGGGNGSFVRTHFSRTLVLWDFISNCPSCGEDQPGDQIVLKNPGARGEWIEYRKLRSFQLLKAQLQKWSAKAPNFINMISEGGFLDGEYRLPIIGTQLHIKPMDELYVSGTYSGLDEAYPSAYFDDATGRAFLDIGLWNQAGIYSQAGMLLHERMRSLQLNFHLTNQEMQNVVFMILKQDPTAAVVYDDTHFTKSWMVTHRKDMTIERAFGGAVQTAFRGLIMNCIDKNDWTCVRDLYESTGQVKNLPRFDVIQLLKADTEVAEAEQKEILTSAPLVPRKLVSSGVNNAPVAETPKNYFFSNMFGAYKITACKDLSVNKGPYDWCNKDHTDLYINFVQNANITSFSFRHGTSGKVTMTMLNDRPGLEKTPYLKYVEQGDSLASYITDFSSSAGKEFSIALNEMTMKRQSDGTYLLVMKGKSQNSLMPKYDHDYSFEISLKKM